MSESSAWHTRTPEAVAAELHGHLDHGLAPAAIPELASRHGRNEIVDTHHRPTLSILVGQFSNLLILILIGAAVISGLLGEWPDAVAILVIVVLNAVVGAIQEYRAEQALAALRQLAAPSTLVMRGGERLQIPASELVPGDLVLLEAGAKVPADLRLTEVHGLEVDESALTGESTTVSKQSDALDDPALPVSDRSNLAFKGTQVTRGRAHGLVVATGMVTELGRIAGLLLQRRPARTPLQQRLDRFGRRLALVVLAVCAIIFIAGVLREEAPLIMFLTAVSLAVAAIPEALPAVVTVSLALGARKMGRNKALVRNLPAVETLGSVTVICADKTGTLTENRMRAEVFVAAGEQLDTLPDATQAGPPWQQLGRALALNNDVHADAEGKPQGEPTELALFTAAAQAGFDKPALSDQLPRVAELPFDAERKRMTTLHAVDGRCLAIVKGAPEALLPQCRAAMNADGQASALDSAALEAQIAELAEQGYRVMAVAERALPDCPADPDPDRIETELVFIGLIALLDPPRPEAAQAVADCRAAGIIPVMITGDHPGTARAIAQRVGIADADTPLLTGQELAAMSDTELERVVLDTRVYARVDPEQKTRIVQALQNRGAFAAMTGDGVNDAPALKHADIGVSMGCKGTDVAREASDLVLLDDNFATIVAAVREGRRIFDNIRKFIRYTMTSNAGEVWTLFLAPLLGLPIPLLPIHILWINLVTDGLPGLALSMERGEPKLMQRRPRPPQESIFAGGMWQHMLWMGLLIGGVSIWAQAWALEHSSAHWQTMVFTVLVFSQLAHALVVRSESEALFAQGPFSNRSLSGALLLTVLLQLAVIYLPWLNPVFRTQPLPLTELLICFALPAIILVAGETEKWLVRHKGLYGSA